VRFILAVVVLTAAIIAGKELAVNQGWMIAPSLFYITLFFVAFSTVLIYGYLVKVQFNNFTQFYLLLTVVKLIAFLAYNLVVVIKVKSQAFPNVIFFLIIYLVFTALEIIFLYRHINSRKAP
jgi:hypothetical protein